MNNSKLRANIKNAFSLIILIIGLAIIIIFIKGNQVDWNILLTFIAALLGSIFSFFYFDQKQDLEEVRLFKELFKELNGRYNSMNEELNEIRGKDSQKELTPKEKNILYDYFNLCSEEYLYFHKGYIYPEVWKAWCNGMKIYLQSERIYKLWKEEEKTDSYYQLTEEVIYRDSTAE